MFATRETCSVLFAKRHWPGLRDGSVTVGFRRWTRPTVKAGGTLQTPAGVLAIDSVRKVSERSITVADARAAGFESREALLRALNRRAEARGRQLYRVGFHYLEEDPRRALREAAELSDEELEAIRARLARMDAGKDGLWTRAVLELIRDRPETLAADLAATRGAEKLPFKANVRRLKALGLTESLPVGYRLSPRGAAVLKRL
jgi:hypothetical protein